MNHDLFRGVAVFIAPFILDQGDFSLALGGGNLPEAQQGSALAALRELVLLAAIALGLLVPTAALATDAATRMIDPARIATGVPTRIPDADANAVRLPVLDRGSDGVTVGGRFVLSGVNIVGATAVPKAELAAIFEPLLATEVGSDDLARIVEGVNQAYRRKGYDFSSAAIPKQSAADGIVRLDVTELRLSCVNVTANGEQSSRYDAFFDAAKEDGPLRSRTLMSDLLRLGDLPGVTNVVSQMRKIDGAGENHCLDITLREKKSSQLIGIDSFGSESIGPLRAYALVGFNGVLKAGDVLRAQVVAVPGAPEEFSAASAGYELPIGNGATRLSLDAGASRVEPRRAEGVGDTSRGSLGVERVLRRTPTSGTWLKLAFDLRDSRFNPDNSPKSYDHVRTLGASARTYKTWNSGSFRVRADIRQGVNVLGASGENDNTSRAGTDAKFTSIGFEGDLETRLSKSVMLGVGASGQVASSPLFWSEQFYLGGALRGHAYDDGQLAGDNGLAGFARLTKSFNVGKQQRHELQVFALGETGIVDRKRDSGFSSQSLSSASAGVRVIAGKLDVSAETAFPLHLTGSVPGEGDPRFRFSITFRN